MGGCRCFLNVYLYSVYLGVFFGKENTPHHATLKALLTSFTGDSQQVYFQPFGAPVAKAPWTAF